MIWWVISIASALLLAALAVFLWVRRPPAPIWPAVFRCQLYALLWVVGDIWATQAQSPLEKQAALVVLFSGSLALPAAWFLTVRRYVAAHGLERPWMKGRLAHLPTAWAAVTWLFMITNPWHGQFASAVVGAANEYHWGARVAFHGNQAIAVATIWLALWAARRHQNPDVRLKMGILAGATLAPGVANALHVYLPFGPRLDPVALGLGLASAAILYGIYRRRLFVPLPVAVTELFRGGPNGLLLLDRGGRLMLWNPAAERMLEGFRLEPDMRVLRALAWRLEDPRSGHALRSSRELTSLLTDDPASPRRQVFVYRGGGERRWLELSLLPVPSRRGRLAAVCVRLEDVTAQAGAERAALADRLRRSEKLESLALMAGAVAHDFNNLLTAIGGHARLALDSRAPADVVAQHLRELIDASDLAGELTRQLLAYTGRGRIADAAVDLSQLVEDMVRILNGSLASRAELRTELAAGLPAVAGDPTQLRRLVMNLVTNAVESLGNAPGLVSFRTALALLGSDEIRRMAPDDRLDPGEHVLLEVSDTGCGMDARTRASIFDPFFTTKSHGRGLGLVAVAGIVRAHRGVVDVTSEPGRGTTFRVWLPSTGAPVRRDPPERSRDGCAVDWRGNGLVLLVDDEARVRRVARSVLERAGFEVVEASGDDEAVALFAEHRGRIRLVLLDLTMPGLGGEGVLAEIHALDPEVRVLLSSGYDESDAMRRLASHKLGGFLHKPYRPDELIEAVRRVLEGDRAPGRAS